MHLPLTPAPAPRLSRLAVTVSPIAIALLMIGTANAQDSVGTAPASPTVPSGAAPGAAPIDATDAIVVTGFRRSVQTSIDIKRLSDIVVDVVTADDIAGLPDVSIAEALARLPGVTSQRTGGQASALNIRGLSQDLVSATLNGREQVATSGDRTIQFDQYPSELISQAAVYKSPKASLIEGGVAGKVELTTARPLANKERLTVTVNARGAWNDRANESPDSNEFGYRVSASVQYKITDDLGVALGYARLSQPNVATRFVGFDFTGNKIPTSAGPASPSYGFELIQFGGNETRDGALGVIQYEPSKDLRILIDGYYSKFDSNVRRRGIRIQGSGGIAPGDVSNATVYDGSIVGATEQSGSGLSGTLVNQIESRNDELYTIGGNIQKDIGKLTFGLDAAYSRASSYFDNAGINVDAFNADGTNRLQNIPGGLVASYQYHGLNLPDISINHDFSNPATNLFQGFYIVPQKDSDELLAFASDGTAHIEGEFVKSLQFGVRYSKRTAVRTITSFDSFGIGNPVVIPSQYLKTAGFDSQFAGHGFPKFLSVDILGLLHQFVGPNLTPDQNFGFTKDQSYNIKEDVWDGYGQMNFDTIAGALPFRGNLGLRVVDSSESSTASTGGVYYTVRDHYFDFLPSFNGILALSPNDQVRAAVARQISRPNFFDLRSSVGIGVGASGIPNGGGGNTKLRPFLADEFEFGYEHYFHHSGIFAVSAFYKYLETFIIDGQTNNFDFRQAGYGALIDGAVQPPGSLPKQDVGIFTQPINGSGGRVYGLEFNFTKSFKDDLPAPFDGLGVLLNYSYTQSSLNIKVSTSGAPLTIPLPGLSKHVANPTIFYEKHGFETRVSLRYRSPYIAPQVGLTSNPAFNAEETVIDAQASYTFQPGSKLAGLKLLLQGENLTDEPNRTYWGAEQRTSTIQYFGRVVYAGAAYRF